MKKIVAVMLIFMLLALGGCGETKENQNVLEVAEFSQETQRVLDLLQNKIYFFDYTIDESIKANSIELWSCTDGVWESSGKSYGNIDAGKRQIAIQIEDNYVEFFDIDDSGYSSARLNLSEEQMKDPNMGTMSTYCTNSSKIEPNKEIALWARWSDEGESAAGYSLNDFREGYCDKGLAVTVTFYDEPFADDSGEAQPLAETLEIEAEVE